MMGRSRKREKENKNALRGMMEQMFRAAIYVHVNVSSPNGEAVRGMCAKSRVS